MFSSHPASTSTPIVTEMTKKIVKMEYKLNSMFNVVNKITAKATTIAIAEKKIVFYDKFHNISSKYLTFNLTCNLSLGIH